MPAMAAGFATFPWSLMRIAELLDGGDSAITFRMQNGSVSVAAISSWPIVAVWALVADIGRWPKWGPPSRAQMVKEGAREVNGVGSYWRVGKRPLTDTYEVPVIEPPHRLECGLIAGLPYADIQALNDRFTDLGGDHPVPYATD